MDRPRRGESGFGLVESVVALAILGLIVAAMVGGMATMISTSAVHRRQSVVNLALVDAIEFVKSLPYNRATCSNGVNTMYSAPVPPGMESEVRSIEVLVANCHFVDPSYPLQLIRIAVIGTSSIASMEFVKGDR